jgi:hypothetical protein
MKKKIQDITLSWKKQGLKYVTTEFHLGYKSMADVPVYLPRIAKREATITEHTLKKN